MRIELKNSIEKFLQNLDTEIDLLSIINIDNIDFKYAFASIEDMIYANNGFDVKVIYYDDAMDYLRRNDLSLRESLSLAHERGFTTDNLNSEILASLLKTENVREEFYQLEDEINNFFEKLNKE